MSRIENWKPEDPVFWEQTGKALAWRTCGITTFSLIFSFATWFVMSAVVVRMPAIGFQFTTTQLFWLAAMPGLASGILRLIHSNFIPVWGTRPVVSISTIIKLLPMIWLGFAIQDLSTPYMTFLIIAFLCGMGGGDFSSFMPSTSIFFPKRLQGLAMGVQAGIGNFGISVVQFTVPWIIGFAVVGGAVGGPQLFTRANVVNNAIELTKNEAGVVIDVVAKRADLVPSLQVERDENGNLKNVSLMAAEGVKLFESKVQRDAAGAIESVSSVNGLHLDLSRNEAGAITNVVLRNVVQRPLWLQNAAFIWIPFLVLAFVLCLVFLRSVQVPSRGFMGQFEILSSRNRANVHTWNCTMTYICSFASFSGFSAAFPMLIRTLYGGFEGAPDPLAYAYLGPLIGGLVRVATGGFFDKIGGSKGMHWTTMGQIVGVVFLIFGGYLTPTSLEQFSGFLYGMLWIFLMTGINNAATFRQYPIVFAYSPAKGAQMLGWTGAWAAFGPFVWNALIGTSISQTGTVVAFFAGCAVFYVYSLFINWWNYTRKNAERFDYGNAGGTWWDKLPKAEQERMKRVDLGQAG